MSFPQDPGDWTWSHLVRAASLLADMWPDLVRRMDDCARWAERFEAAPAPPAAGRPVGHGRTGRLPPDGPYRELGEVRFETLDERPVGHVRTWRLSPDGLYRELVEERFEPLDGPAAAEEERRHLRMWRESLDDLRDLNERLVAAATLLLPGLRPDLRAVVASDIEKCDPEDLVREWQTIIDRACHQPVKVLRGSYEILRALGLPTDKSTWRRVKRLNDLTGGPIRYRGNQPWVVEGHLHRWWNSLTSRADDLERRLADLAAAAGAINEADPRGAADLAAADMGLSLRHRGARTHLARPRKRRK